jgi:hypothetical protein
MASPSIFPQDDPPANTPPPAPHRAASSAATATETTLRQMPTPARCDAVCCACGHQVALTIGDLQHVAQSAASNRLYTATVTAEEIPAGDAA